MPGPWFLCREDQGAWTRNSRVRRIFIELRLLDNGRHPKGIAFVRVEEREDQARYGEWRSREGMEGYLQWWLDEGEGPAEQS